LACTPTGHGNLATFTSNPTSWTQYQYNYTATKTVQTLMFGLTRDSYGSYYWFLDTVSVVDVSAPGTQLLQNPGFDNSTTALTGWIQYCGTTCGGGAGKVTTTGCQSMNCYVDGCNATISTTKIDFLSQTFPTTIGHIYTISFWIVSSGSGANLFSKAYVDIY
jgi:hypothetical protein